MKRYYSFGQIEQDPTGGRLLVAAAKAPIYTSAAPGTVTTASMLRQAAASGRLTLAAPTTAAAAPTAASAAVLPLAIGALAALMLLK